MEPMPEQHDEHEADSEDGDTEDLNAKDKPDGQTGAGVIDDEMQKAMLLAGEELTAAKYRDWEQWQLQHDMGSIHTRAREVLVRGAVRHVHGGLGTSQSMQYYLHDDERLEVQIYAAQGGSSQGRKRPVQNVSTQYEEQT